MITSTQRSWRLASECGGRHVSLTASRSSGASRKEESGALGSRAHAAGGHLRVLMLNFLLKDKPARSLDAFARAVDPDAAEMAGDVVGELEEALEVAAQHVGERNVKGKAQLGRCY